MNIVFPENLPEQQRIRHVPPALIYITKLLYRSATGLSLVYIVLLLVVQPLLEIQYDRRMELLSSTLDRAQKVLKLLNKVQPLPPVAVKRGDKYYSDANVQTLEDEKIRYRNSTYVTFEDEAEKHGTGDKVQDNLIRLRDCIEHYNKYCVDLSVISPTNFQVKRFQNRVEAYKTHQLFKPDAKSLSSKSATSDIRQQIRTIKGWYLTGQV